MYCCSWIQLLVLYLFILHDGIYLLVTVLEETLAEMVYFPFLAFLLVRSHCCFALHFAL